MAFNIGNRSIRIAVGVGHANTSGGNQYELRKNREVMAEFLKLARESTGFDVRCYTPNDGQGTYPGGLDEVVYATVHKWVQAGWLPDVVFEIHHEGLGNTSVRGGFIIHPAASGLYGRHNGVWGAKSDYVDTDVVAAGPGMARIITQALGVPLRYGTGLMSERDTGVGGQGYRLGYFGALSDAYFQQNAAVFISEAATYTNPTDLWIMNQPDFAGKEARALFEAIAYLGRERGAWTFPYKIGGASPTPPPAPTPDPKPAPGYQKPSPVAALANERPFLLTDGGAIFVRADVIVEAVKDTPRLKYAGGSAKVGPDIRKGDRFAVDYLIVNNDQSLYWYTPWATRVRYADTRVVE